MFITILLMQVLCILGFDFFCIYRFDCYFAKLSLNSTQSQLKLRLRLALIPPDPATHPPGTVDSTLHDSSRQIQGCFKTTLRVPQHHIKTTLKLL